VGGEDVAEVLDRVRSCPVHLPGPPHGEDRVLDGPASGGKGFKGKN